MCVGLGVACWPWRCILALFMCVDIVIHAGLVACWLIRFMVVLLHSIGLIVAYLPF